MLTSLPDRIVRKGDARKRIAYMHPFFFASSGCFSWCSASGETGKICKNSFFWLFKITDFCKNAQLQSLRSKGFHPCRWGSPHAITPEKVLQLQEGLYNSWAGHAIPGRVLQLQNHYLILNRYYNSMKGTTSSSRSSSRGGKGGQALSYPSSCQCFCMHYYSLYTACGDLSQ